jgi:hypothetical protein
VSISLHLSVHGRGNPSLVVILNPVGPHLYLGVSPSVQVFRHTHRESWPAFGHLDATKHEQCSSVRLAVNNSCSATLGNDNNNYYGGSDDDDDNNNGNNNNNGPHRMEKVTQ